MTCEKPVDRGHIRNGVRELRCKQEALSVTESPTMPDSSRVRRDCGSARNAFLCNFARLSTWLHDRHPGRAGIVHRCPPPYLDRRSLLQIRRSQTLFSASLTYARAMRTSPLSSKSPSTSDATRSLVFLALTVRARPPRSI